MSTISSRTPATWSTANRVGLVLTLLLGLGDFTSAFSSPPEGEIGPPFAILLADTVLGFVTVSGVITAWIRGSRLAARIAAGCVLLTAISALPALFVDVPPMIKAAVGAATLVTVLACGLMLAPARRH